MLVDRRDKGLTPQQEKQMKYIQSKAILIAVLPRNHSSREISQTKIQELLKRTNVTYNAQRKEIGYA